MTGEGTVERWHASDLRKRGDYGVQGAENGKQEMLPEIPYEVRRNRVGNKKAGPSGRKGSARGRGGMSVLQSFPGS